MAETKYPVGRYRLTTKAYAPRMPGGMCEVLNEGEEITFDGAPGAHMEPLDEDARGAVALAAKDRRLGSLDPTASLALTQGADTQNTVLVQALENMRGQMEALHAENARLRGDVAAPAPLVLPGAPAVGTPVAPEAAALAPPPPPVAPAAPPLPGR